MDTYGHLFPGQEADAVAGLRSMLSEAGDSLPPEALRATGTDDLTVEDPEGAQRQAQRAERETRRSTAKECERESAGDAQKKSPKPLQIADLGDCVRDGALCHKSSPGGTRTPDQGIMSPLL